MSKHTPGPWTHLGMGEIHGHEANGRGVDIAAVYLREKWLANARLIAAAPELLEALIECMPILVSLDTLPGEFKTLVKARAAIAKATGETK